MDHFLIYIYVIIYNFPCWKQNPQAFADETQFFCGICPVWYSKRNHTVEYVFFAPGLFRTLFPGVFSRHCFFFFCFFCFFVMWALRTQCVNYEEPPLCPHALRQNRCVCLCVCVCLAVCCCCVCGGRSLRNPELLVPPGFFFLFFFFHFFFRGVPLTFPSLVVCVCVGQTLACVHCVNVYVCKKKNKINRHLSFGGASVDPPPVRYI